MKYVNGHSICKSDGLWWVDVCVMCVSLYQVALAVGLTREELAERGIL